MTPAGLWVPRPGPHGALCGRGEGKGKGRRGRGRGPRGAAPGATAVGVCGRGPRLTIRRKCPHAQACKLLPVQLASCSACGRRGPAGQRGGEGPEWPRPGSMSCSCLPGAPRGSAPPKKALMRPQSDVGCARRSLMPGSGALDAAWGCCGAWAAPPSPGGTGDAPAAAAWSKIRVGSGGAGLRLCTTAAAPHVLWAGVKLKQPARLDRCTEDNIVDRQETGAKAMPCCLQMQMHNGCMIRHTGAQTQAMKGRAPSSAYARPAAPPSRHALVLCAALCCALTQCPTWLPAPS